MHTIDGLTSPYIVVLLLRGIIFVFAASLAALFLGLGLHKRHVVNVARSREEKILFYAGELVSLCAGTTASVTAPRNLREALSLASAFASFSFHDDAEISRAQSAIAASPEIQILKNALSSEDWGVRCRALGAFSDLRDPAYFEYLCNFAEHEEVVRVFGSCLSACAILIREPGQFREFSLLLDRRPVLSASYDEGAVRTAIRSLISRSGAAESYQVMRDCLFSETLSEQYKAALINAIGKENFTRMTDAIIDYAQVSEERIIRISAMRALYNMGVCDGLISRGFRSADPVVQIVAIRSSLHCDGAVEEQLVRFLGSPHFDVRYAAAMTLVKFPSGGQELLQQAKAGSDPFATDMAEFALSVR
ncbi:MAG: HEAT repeat domain-containing protein [Acidiferrobacterales bacterium]